MRWFIVALVLKQKSVEYESNVAQVAFGTAAGAVEGGIAAGGQQPRSKQRDGPGGGRWRASPKWPTGWAVAGGRPRRAEGRPG